MHRCSNMKTLIPCLVVSIAGSLSACADVAAATGQDRQLATRRVNFADLDLTRNDGAATLYSRIRSAAKYVCRPSTVTWEWTTPATNRCMEKAVNQAVEDVNSPALKNLHLAHTKPTIRLARDQR